MYIILDLKSSGFDRKLPLRLELIKKDGAGGGEGGNEMGFLSMLRLFATASYDLETDLLRHR